MVMMAVMMIANTLNIAADLVAVGSGMTRCIRPRVVVGPSSGYRYHRHSGHGIVPSDQSDLQGSLLGAAVLHRRGGHRDRHGARCW